jgi:hypothetical protein
VTQQRALQFGPGRYRTLLTFAGTPEEARKGCADLLDHIAVSVPPRSPLYILVAVAREAILVTDRTRQFLEAVPSELSLRGSQLVLLVQIAAENADDVTFAKRLVRFALKNYSLTLEEELDGARHLLERENFGLVDRTDPEPDRPQAERVQGRPALDQGDGAVWLAYQRCIQRVDEFRSGEADRARAQHVELMRSQSYDQSLRRRSFPYETYEEVGLAFLATATDPRTLLGAIELFQAEVSAIHDATEVSAVNRGLFVVPPDVTWLDTTDGRTTAALPAWVLTFRREHSLQQYDVTPSMLKFLKQAFRDNAKNLHDQNGKLRADLQLLLRGIILLALGEQVPADSVRAKALAATFGKPATRAQADTAVAEPDPVNAIAQELAQQNPKEQVAREARLVRQQDLFELALKAADEAIAANNEAREYITFTV